MIKETGDGLTIQVVIPFNRSMLEAENAIQNALNEAGTIERANFLKRFDTDGSPIVIGQTTLTSKGTVPKEYQTAYGAITVKRHVYQSSKGGKTFCPMEREARIVTSATPRFAMQLSHKYAEGSAGRVVEELRLNHNRGVAKAYVQTVADAVAAVAMVKEEQWSYQVPQLLESDVTTISIGIDGTCLLMCQDGWREAMVGTISLYDRAAERLHTTYIGATPEYGKTTFFKRMSAEIAKISAAFAKALKVGVADGAKTNLLFLTQHTERQILDFDHAAQYLTQVADAQFARYPKASQQWLDDACYRLKHESTGPQVLIAQMQGFLAEQKLSGHRAKIKAALSYYQHQCHLMKYLVNYLLNSLHRLQTGSLISHQTFGTKLP
jgi:hypothetical protein